VALSLILLAAFAAQLGFGDGDPTIAAREFGLVPASLWSSRGSGIFTYVLLHVGWTHLMVSVLMTIVLGTPLARRMPGFMGFVGLVTFFLICGAVGGVVFAATQPNSRDILIGASAGVSGLLASAARTARIRHGVAPLFSPLLLGIGAVWLGINLLAAVTQFAGPSAFTEYGWQAHAAGFVAGALLTGAWVRLFGKSVFASDADLGNPAP
jgi:membrane associated rhomboid family serine protease